MSTTKLREALGPVPGEHDYPTEPIGGGNPYYRCSACGRSDPDISVNGHGKSCTWAERRALLTAALGELQAIEAMMAERRYSENEALQAATATWRRYAAKPHHESSHLEDFLRRLRGEVEAKRTPNPAPESCALRCTTHPEDL